MVERQGMGRVRGGRESEAINTHTEFHISVAVLKRSGYMAHAPPSPTYYSEVAANLLWEVPQYSAHTQPLHPPLPIDTVHSHPLLPTLVPVCLTKPQYQVPDIHPVHMYTYIRTYMYMATTIGTRTH